MWSAEAFWVLCGLVLLPVLAYLCAKFGAYGVLKGRELFERGKKDQREGGDS